MLRPLIGLPQRRLAFAPPLRASRTPLTRAPIRTQIPRRDISSAPEQAVQVGQEVAKSIPAQWSTVRELRERWQWCHDTTGIPWVWLIPAAALAVRLIMYFPITRAHRRAQQRRFLLSPLLNASKPVYLNQARRGFRDDPRTLISQAYKDIAKADKAQLTEDYNCDWRLTFFRPLFQLPVFIGMSCSLRTMMGPLPFEEGPMNPARFEPSMMEEGLPWAIDFTAADPTGFLSYGVAAIMAITTLRAGETNRFMTRFLLLCSIGIGPFFSATPAGVLWYWLCSSGTALLQNLYVDWKYPITRIRPCKRPVLRGGVSPKT